MNQSKLKVITCSWQKVRKNGCEWIPIYFGFTPDWIKKWRECFKPTGWRGKWNTDYFPTLIPWAVQLLLKPWDLWLLKWSDLVRVLGAKLPVVAQESTGILEETPIRVEVLTSFWTLHFRMWLNTLMKSNRRFTSSTVTTGALMWCDVTCNITFKLY